MLDRNNIYSLLYGCYIHVTEKQQSIHVIWMLDSSMSDYKGVNLPREMMEYIDILRKRPFVKRKYGFKSTAAFVKRAVQDLIDKIESDIRKEKERIRLEKLAKKED